MPPFKREFECTAYCSCGYCCKWEWGFLLPGPFYLGFQRSLIPFKLCTRKQGYKITCRMLLIAKFWTGTKRQGSPYYGTTTSGSFPVQVRPPIFSKLSLMQYRQLLIRILLPWKLLPRHGTIAADTEFYPFGTLMFIPGYGWGKVEDTGSAIKGPSRIDLYYRSHNDALVWGRQKVTVLVVLPGDSTIDGLPIPEALKMLLKLLDWFSHLLF